MENNEVEEDREQRLKDEKEVQYYMALVTAWINTKMEHDKTIITLSSAAIGLLITILTTKGVEQVWHLWLFVLSFLGYTVAISTSLFILQKNSVIIENELGKKDGHKYKLERYDNIARFSFILGTIAFVLIGIFTAFSKFKETDKMTANKEQTKPQSAPEDVRKSLQGIGNLRPNQSQNSSGSNQNQSNNTQQGKK